MEQEKKTTPPKKITPQAQRREREREYRYRTILSAAEALFAQKGFRKTSVEEIADLSEVSVGTVYFYFKDKEELLIHLFDESLYQLRSILGKEFERADSPVRGMAMAGHAFFDEFCTHYAQKALILFRESPGHGKRMESRRKNMSELIAKDLSQAIDRLRKDAGCKFRSKNSSAVYAMCILGVYEKVAYHFLTEPDDPERTKEMALDAVDFIIGGIKDITGPANLQ
ncbi:MAG: TetR/AcrR family transcriptional regulator [Proteobacteria bacterium]|nr:TetR/AcrR family transcriptional regulator [Pseudomonadota bacterium]